MDIQDGLTFDRVAGILTEECRWIFAKTMPQWPHEYTLRKEWPSEDVPFEAVVQFIRDYGYRERFKPTGSVFTRLNVNGKKYWTMGAPLPTTILINRADLERQEPYDAIADIYDALWNTEAAHEEDRRIVQRLNYAGGSVLDIGCGTGLLLDHIRPERYVGIDPSRKMLTHLRQKFPDAETVATKFESFFTREKFDLIVGLFGAASYIEPSALIRLPVMLAPGGRFFLMFYAPGYEPETYRMSGVMVPHYPFQIDGFSGPVSNFDHFGNFLIVEGGA